MILSIISILVNVLYFVVLNLKLYTDRAVLGDGIAREWQKSPIDRLYAADKNVLLYVQILLAAVSIITGILVIAGVKNNIVKIVQLSSTISSTVMFIVILSIAGSTHPRY